MCHIFFSTLPLLKNGKRQAVVNRLTLIVVSPPSLHLFRDGGFNVVLISTSLMDAMVISKAIHQKSPIRFQCYTLILYPGYVIASQTCVCFLQHSTFSLKEEIRHMSSQDTVMHGDDLYPR